MILENKVTYKFRDFYNFDKIWVVKKYNDGTYYMAQEFFGIKQYPMRRFTKKHLDEIGIFDMDLISKSE